MGDARNNRRIRAPLALFALSFAAVATLSANAFAAPKDAKAEKELRTAMESDYLETRFGDAEARLHKAIDGCGASGCSKKVKAKLYVGLGTVLAGGSNNLDDAKDAFVQALLLDKNAKVDPALAQTSIRFAFEQAKEEVAKGGGKPAGDDGDDGDDGGGATTNGPLKHRASKDHELNRPLAIYAELSDELMEDAAAVTVSYAPPGEDEFNALDMKKVKKGYGIEIPCKDVEDEGPFRYYIVVAGKNGEILESVGSESDPFSTEITANPASKPAHFPGYEAPPKCGEVGAGALQCIDSNDCSGGLSCEQGRCLAPEVVVEKDTRTSFIGLHFAPDLAFVSGDDVCSEQGQADGHFLCVRNDGTRYEGTPVVGNGNNITGGAGFATMRLVLSYEHVLGDAFTLGGRFGWAFGGASEGGASFFPVHLEARGAFWFGNKPFESTGARPYFFLSGGLAQIDTRVSVQVLEDGKACGADPSKSTSPCTQPAPGDDRVEPRKQELAVYKRAGLAFAGGGLGIGYAPFEAMMLDMSVRASVTFPVVTPVITPEIGVRVGF